MGGLIALATLLQTSPGVAASCLSAGDCATGFCVNKVCCDSACSDPCEACSAAKKGGGKDGTCGLAAPGNVCKEPRCDMGSFSFVAASKCDGAGTCVEPAGVSCYQNNPCALDLCSDVGCELVFKLDGSECGVGMVCVKDACVPGVATSSGGAGGAGGAGGSSGAGEAGMGGAGEGGSPSDVGGGSPGAGGASSSSSGDPYPPRIEDMGCGCRAAGDAPSGGAVAIGMAALGLLSRRRRARRSLTRAELSPAS